MSILHAHEKERVMSTRLAKSVEGAFATHVRARKVKGSKRDPFSRVTSTFSLADERTELLLRVKNKQATGHNRMEGRNTGP